MTSYARGRCKLLDLIQSRGWTQTQYAGFANRSPRMISYFCSGERAMLPEDIKTAMVIFNLTVIDEVYEFIEVEIEE